MFNHTENYRYYSNYEKTLRLYHEHFESVLRVRNLKQLMIIRNIKIEDSLANTSIQVIRVKNNF